MIYLDCAATSLQKPPEVARAVSWAMRNCSSPGRGDHPVSKRAAEILFRCREEGARLFDADGPEQVVFTSNATHGLNIAIRSLVPEGGKVVISGYEHNAVTRTLASIPNVEVVRAAGEPFNQESDLAAFEGLIDDKTSAVICTHASNVFGYILPVDEIAKLCSDRSVPLIVDASQSAGVLPVSLNRWQAACIAMPGHKGLLGPQGTGMLIWSGDREAKPLLTGGTGSESRLQQMPDFLPDRLEAGTQNVAGIAGLLEGMRFVSRTGPERILRHERRLAERLRRVLGQIDGMELFGPRRLENATGVVSFRVSGRDCEELAWRLSEQGVCLRAGLHCAPLAHHTAGTLETGTLRVSVSPYTTEREIDTFLFSILRVLQK